VDDDAPPFDSALDLVDLEGDPGMVVQRGQLRSGRRPSVQPFMRVDVMNGLDVDPIAERERQSSNVVAPQDRLRRFAIELAEHRAMSWRHVTLR
jgi:hypothetical protein